MTDLQTLLSEASAGSRELISAQELSAYIEFIETTINRAALCSMSAAEKREMLASVMLQHFWIISKGDPALLAATEAQDG